MVSYGPHSTARLNTYPIEFKKAHTLFYKPYPPLESGSIPKRVQELERIQTLINASQWHDAQRTSHTLIQEALRGLHYLQTYDRTLLRTVVTFAYLGWMLYASLYIIRPLDNPTFPQNSLVTSLLTLIPILIALTMWVVFYAQRSPWSYYIYVSFPAYFWSQFLRQGFLYFAAPLLNVRVLNTMKDHVPHLVLVLGALLGLAVRCSCFLSPLIRDPEHSRWGTRIGSSGLLVLWLFRMAGFLKKMGDLTSVVQLRNRCRCGMFCVVYARRSRGCLWIEGRMSSLCESCLEFTSLLADDLPVCSAMGGIAFLAVGQYALPLVLKEIEKEFGREVEKRMEKKFAFQVRSSPCAVLNY